MIGFSDVSEMRSLMDFEMRHLPFFGGKIA